MAGGDTGGRQSRRRFLKWGALGVAGVVVAERSAAYVRQSTARARVVVVGGGSAGITVCSLLSRRLRDPDITLIEPNVEHHYQPGYTLVAAGEFTPEEVAVPTRGLVPREVRWVQDRVRELAPDRREVVTEASGVVPYDFLVLVPGCQVNYGEVAGITRETLGEGGAHSIYDLEGARRYWAALQELADRKGGRVVFTDTYTHIKCGGVPKKVAFLTEHYLRRRGAREGAELHYYCNSTHLMKPAVFGDRLVGLFGERGIATAYKHRLESVDRRARTATFVILPQTHLGPLPAGENFERVVVGYDLLHFTPPMSAPEFVRRSPLGFREGDLAHGGWVEADPRTLVHRRYAEILSFGDVAGLPTSKTGAAVRKQAPVAAENLVALMEGREPVAAYDGYSACPIITEYGKVLMCEFGYDYELMPTVAGLDPAVERELWWMLKRHGLKPMYFHGMLRGWI